MSDDAVHDALNDIVSATMTGALTSGAARNLRQWLTEPRYDQYVPQVLEHVNRKQWKELDDAFWTVIPFGTGGRRGRMYPIGCNTINERTIGESAQGLAAYTKEKADKSQSLACAIAYDTRHNSRRFAELCAGIMVAAGLKVFFLEDYRSTPELSFLVRYKNCSCGIMVTASHNPPSDNAVKVYWSNGAQVLPPHDKAIIDRVMSVQEIRVTPFEDAIREKKVEFCKDAIDDAYLAQVVAQRFPGPRSLRVIYSPLHGVGAASVCPVLAADGFADVEVFAPHAQPSGDFPNVPGNVSNPENPKVFDSIIERGQKSGADLILATDPDCDRMGAAAPVTTDSRGAWATFTGNQLGALLTDFVLEEARKSNRTTKDHYVVKTLVTTDMIRRIADAYGVRTLGNLHVGFKWIVQQVDAAGPDLFLFGTEESHGYLVGTYARDKDGAVACMLLAEMAAKTKAAGQSLHQKLEALWWQHGYHAEQTVNIFMEGSEGMTRMQQLMQQFRQSPPQAIAGLKINAVRDYASLTIRDTKGQRPLDAPSGDMVILDLEAAGNYIAVRPSGTEPKVKFYIFTYTPAEMLHDLDATKIELDHRIRQISSELKAMAAAV
jgi:phosphomannomutase